MGKLLMAAQYLDAAESFFLAAQHVNSGDFRWPYYLGQLYRTQGELQKSVPLFERVLQLQPDDVAALVWLGDVYLSLGRLEGAEPQFAKALSRQPDSLSARFGLGRVALARQDYTRAAAYLEEVLAKDPEAAGAHYPLGMAYRGLDRLDQADVHLRQREEREILPADPLMVELDELLESAQAYESRGIRALNREDWTEAAVLFRKGLVLDPGNPALRHRLGTALYMLGDQRAAREEFEAVIRTTPDHRMAQYSLGVLLQADGRHREAADRFSAALRARPSYVEARLRLAASLRKSGRAKESLTHYDQVLAANPDLTEARFGIAIALVQLGRYQEARDRLADGMKAYPAEQVFPHGLARLLATAPDDRIRDGRRAMTLVQDLLKKGRTLDLGATMAMALAELGQFSEAAALQRDLIAAAEKNGLKDVVPRLKENLGLYERSEPCRTPWADNELQ
jgi:tetratricopeptide (TPR) repeat protein